MRCPYCNSKDTRVIDSRSTDDDKVIRRRRKCENCKKRFSTYERYEDNTLIVIKKDNTRQKFDKNKIVNGILKSTEKRPVSISQVENIVEEIENELNATDKKEIPSTEIGKLVMNKLRKLDQVSYVRFASVYREFKDVDSFYKEIKKLKKDDD
ncbi:MAG: transcriptional regulator NrdR [Peptoniphilaceae bacterium]|nr:transcriptional regulator NrdR [Peptoniphilaceae bacterium]MDD7383587.1 transcriptional regulator NrdR [Peptoniphilaceae bacterium]MDY3738759.1 transcriptional regulator NrdR [Peptoniphilaceae bacterium]